MGINLGGAIAAINPVAAIGAAVGGDLASTAYANRQSEHMMHQQMDFEQMMYGSRYQTQVKDLQAAGLNPMLAYGQSPGSAPQVQQGQVFKSDVGGKAIEGMQAASQIANVNADTKNKTATNNLIDAQTQNTLQTAEMNKKEVQRLSHLIDLAEADVNNARQEWLNKKGDLSLKNAMYQAEYKRMQLMDQQSRLLGNQIAISNPDAAAALTTGAFRAHGRNISHGLRPITDLLPYGMRYYGNGE